MDGIRAMQEQLPRTRKLCGRFFQSLRLISLTNKIARKRAPTKKRGALIMRPNETQPIKAGLSGFFLRIDLKQCTGSLYFDCFWLHGLWNFAFEVNVQQSVIQIGAGDANMIREVEAAFE